MGRNRDLRKKLAGYEQIIARHERRILNELAKEQPDESLLAGWKREIKTWKDTVERLTRRLNRKW
jgi:hypothetical protein